MTSCSFLLSTPKDAEPPDPGIAWSGTAAAWRERVPRAPEYTVAQRDARHAYAVLTGLTSSSGGMVAAATTSLPERASQGRNYDYRYAWIRDQCYAGQAAAAAGGRTCSWTMPCASCAIACSSTGLT